MLKLLLLLSLCFLGCESKKTLVYEGRSMTMPYKIIIADPLSAEEMQKVLDTLAFTFKEVNSIYNNWNPDSEVSYFNREKHSRALSKPLHKLLIIVDKVYHLSEKRFDPTVGPLSMAFHKAYQEDTTLEITDSTIGWDLVDLDERLIGKKDKKISLDLCGIAKGYCLDLLIERFQDLGIKNALVEWAGEIRACGKKQSLDWKVQIDEKMPLISLNNEAIATSGNCYHHISKGQSISHVIHPIKKLPMSLSSAVKKVSVKAPTCAIADSLATAAMTHNHLEEAQKWAQKITEKHPEITFWFYHD